MRIIVVEFFIGRQRMSAMRETMTYEEAYAGNCRRQIAKPKRPAKSQRRESTGKSASGSRLPGFLQPEIEFLALLLQPFPIPAKFPRHGLQHERGS